jgi:hypothetical protein
VKPEVVGLSLVNKHSCVIGQDTEMSWKFSGIEKPQVTWSFNGRALVRNDRFRVAESNDEKSILTILKTQFIDAGVYTARARNSVGEVEANMTLAIVGIKPVIITDLGAQLQVMKGQTMTLMLVISGTPKPKITWMRGNDELALDTYVRVTLPTDDNDGTHTLTVANVQPQHQGEYSAKIENIAGSLRSGNCRVFVIGK